jgi:hypothetical protein
LPVYTPLDERPLYVVREATGEDTTTNKCRAASQILTGIEMFQILCVIEAIISGKVPWIPVSLHHDKFAVLARKGDFEQWKKIVCDLASQRAQEIGLRPIVLESMTYNDVKRAGELIEILGNLYLRV